MDVTVQVIAPGSLTTWGQGGWNTDAWGLTPGVGTQVNSVTVDAQLERGWGAQTWGENLWGDLSNEVALPTGISASLTLGPLEFAGATTGWGRQEWGALGWGIGGTTLAVGSEITSSVGSVSINANANINPNGIELAATAVSPSIITDVSFSVTGIEITITGGEESIDIGVPVTGSSLTANTNDVATFSSNGWGRGEWGSFAWGVNYSVAPSGQELTSTIGDAVGFTDFEADVTGQELSATFGNFSIQIDQDIFVFASEDQLDASTGTVTNIGTANVEVSNSAPNFQFTAQGNAALSTDQAKFGVSSLELDGTDDIVDTTTNLDLSSGDFTIDLWIRPNSVSGYKGIWETGTSTKLVSYLLGNTVYLTVGGSTIISNSVTVSANEWTMLSYERVGNNHYIYKNGALADTGSTANRPDNGIFSIGESSFGDFNGYIDEFRVSSVARYSGASFTQPTEAFTFDSDTQFLLHFDGADGSTVIKSADDTLFQGTFSEGQVIPENLTVAEVTGSEISMSLGSISLEQSTNEPVTGQQLALSIGDEEQITIYSVSGIQSTLSVGSVTVTGSAGIDVSGISASISVGSATTQGWNEVDLGVNNIWRDVDLAA